MADLAAELRALVNIPQKVTQITRAGLFSEAADALDALKRLYEVDMEADRCEAMLLKARADRAARGLQTNPINEQRAATRAAINRKAALKEADALFAPQGSSPEVAG